MRSELPQEAIDVFGKSVRGSQSDRISNRMGAQSFGKSEIAENQFLCLRKRQMVHLGRLIDGLCNLLRVLQYDRKKHVKMQFLCPEMSKSYHRETHALASN